MVQCWAHKPEDRPTFVALRDFLLEVKAGLPVGAGGAEWGHPRTGSDLSLPPGTAHGYAGPSGL